MGAAPVDIGEDGEWSALSERCRAGLTSNRGQPPCGYTCAVHGRQRFASRGHNLVTPTQCVAGRRGRKQGERFPFLLRERMERGASECPRMSLLELENR